SDGTRLVTASGVVGLGGVAAIWNVRDGSLIRRFAGHRDLLFDAELSPDGRFLVSPSGDDTCKVWRVEDGLRMDTLPQPLKEEYACAFSPDGRTIVAGGADNTIRVWDF